MSEQTTPDYEYDGDGEDREDLGPGEQVDTELFSEVEEDSDYEVIAESWIGEPARTEFRIHPIDGGEPKRFVFAEPDSEETMNQILLAVIEDDRYRLCSAVVDEPELTYDRWANALTERERSLLFDHVAAWVRLSDYVDIDVVEDGLA
ncbi:hypothetical protein [Halalkalicoccus jeotgali]|uniref:Uncharacterized protein n=1 Tax=Halalkalicoccus jeotgali (strain DSM 18796 / CECT 7217 / JCM 14584 / KCTC 4019 / B3) TaxID=795797 RepID=D8J9U8_HALJB|nr:hypothetical protein [Halalkalicoccus jeotgali]ADJ14470.1 hypothetical protein HacjB3_05395 [Halalkalicoccus jeotgali B3]ELY40184.1 hypothetical protein C497_03770 [Halalkalicoccus jeotgali B3]